MTREAFLEEIENVWRSCRRDPVFVRELRRQFAQHAGRPTPLTRADRLADRLGGGFRIYLKREDLGATGSAGINSCLGHALLARRMGRTRMVGGDRAGQRGVAAASAARALGLKCVVYMGDDSARGRDAALRMRQMGAEVLPAGARAGASADPDLEAERDWAGHQGETYLLPASPTGDSPCAAIERDFEGVIGHEARIQVLESEGRIPDALVAGVGQGSGALGLFQAFLDDRAVLLFGVGVEEDDPFAETRERAPAPPPPGTPDRVRTVTVACAEAVAAARLLAATEGIQPGPCAARAVAFVARQGRGDWLGRTILVAVSDRGDEVPSGKEAQALPAGLEAER
jgi:tryptophan synthase beta subunit